METDIKTSAVAPLDALAGDAKEVRASSPILGLMARFGGGAIAFGAARATVLFLPLLLARSWDLRSYGLFEYSMAWGTLLAVPFGMGIAGAIPYFLLKKKDPRYVGAFQLHSLLAGASLLLLGILNLVFSFSFLLYLTLFLAGVLVIQNILATLYMAGDAPGRASVIDNGVYVVLFLLVLPLVLLGHTPNFKMLVITLNLYALFLVLVFLRGFWTIRHWRNGLSHYGQAIRFGLPLVVTSGCIIFLASSTRLLAGKFLSVEEVGVYSFFFRIAAPVVLVHNLLATIYFRKIYQSEERDFDTYLSVILVAIFTFGLFLYLSVPTLFRGYFLLLQDLKGERLQVYWVLVVQMVCWVAMALCEFILYRENQARRFSFLLLGTVGAMLVGSFLLRFAGRLTLLTLSQLQMGALFLTVFGQVSLLRRHGVRLVKAPVVVAAVLGIYIIGFLFLAT